MTAPQGPGRHDRLHPLNRTAEIRPYRSVEGGALRPAKRALRRALRWYLWPVADKVSTHNRAVAATVEEHRRQLTWMRMETERLAHDAALVRPSR